LIERISILFFHFIYSFLIHNIYLQLTLTVTDTNASRMNYKKLINVATD